MPSAVGHQRLDKGQGEKAGPWGAGRAKESWQDQTRAQDVRFAMTPASRRPTWCPLLLAHVIQVKVWREMGMTASKGLPLVGLSIMLLAAVFASLHCASFFIISTLRALAIMLSFHPSHCYIAGAGCELGAPHVPGLCMP